MTIGDLRQKQALPLAQKIIASKQRIKEWYEYWDGEVAVSFSGGKDSTVLLHLVRTMYPDVMGVFSDTGLEFPELRKFAMSERNITVVKPRLAFPNVIKKYGYPIISKQQSRRVHDLQFASDKNKASVNLRLTGYASDGRYCPTMRLSKKWQYLKDADFVVGDSCCNQMKKNPLKKFYHTAGLHPMTAVMAEESNKREQAWKMHGCNAFDLKDPISTPIAFWTEQDVLQYIKRFNLPYASVYGDLIEMPDGKLKFTGCQRTGCVFCGFGCHLEKEPNRFQNLAVTHPQLYDYCMRGGKYDESGKWVPDKGLGMAKVLDYINVKWWNDGDEGKRDDYREKYKSKENEQ